MYLSNPSVINAALSAVSCNLASGGIRFPVFEGGVMRSLDLSSETAPVVVSAMEQIIQAGPNFQQMADSNGGRLTNEWKVGHINDPGDTFSHSDGRWFNLGRDVEGNYQILYTTKHGQQLSNFIDIRKSQVWGHYRLDFVLSGAGSLKEGLIHFLGLESKTPIHHIGLALFNQFIEGMSLAMVRGELSKLLADGAALPLKLQDGRLRCESPKFNDPKRDMIRGYNFKINAEMSIHGAKSVPLSAYIRRGTVPVVDNDRIVLFAGGSTCPEAGLIPVWKGLQYVWDLLELIKMRAGTGFSGLRSSPGIGD